MLTKKPIDRNQAWFWTKEWQEAEKAASEDIARNRVTEFERVEDLIDNLHEGEKR